MVCAFLPFYENGKADNIEENEREYSDMKFFRTLARGAAVCVCVLLLSLGSAAAELPRAFFDGVTVGEVLTAADRLQAAYNGNTAATKRS